MTESLKRDATLCGFHLCHTECILPEDCIQQSEPTPATDAVSAAMYEHFKTRAMTVNDIEEFLAHARQLERKARVMQRELEKQTTLSETREIEVIDPYVMDLVRKHGHEMTNSEIVQKFLPKQTLPSAIAWKPGEPRVVCAAIRDPHGRLVTGARHFDGVMMEQIRRGPGSDSWRGGEQGFIDQHGKFLTREEAHEIATRWGQILRRVGSDSMSLFSENLY